MTTPKIPRRNQRLAAATGAAALPAGEGGDAGMDRLHAQLRKLLGTARQKVQRSINDAMVQTYWEMGRLIVEAEQGSEARAAHGGPRTLPQLAERLVAEFGNGCSVQGLSACREFYLGFPNLSTAWRELSWSHYRLLMRVPDELARKWYAYEAASQGWSVRALELQIATRYHERLLASQDKAATQAEAVAVIAAQAPYHAQDFVRDPCVLEFLGAAPYEPDLEQSLLDRIQAFMLGLDKGFAWVARQRPLRVDNADHLIGLVFYNYLLKCFLLLHLKLGPLSDQDAGQMDTWVRVFDDRQRQSGDNPTLGLLLGSERYEAVARYSLPPGGEDLFASRYRPWLPGEGELKAELERARLLIEAGR